MGNKAVKSTEQLAQLCIEGLDDLSLNGANEKSIEQVGLTIQAIKNILLGKPISQLKKKDKDKIISDEDREELAKLFVKISTNQQGLIEKLIVNMKYLQVDCKRNIVSILSHLAKTEKTFKDHVALNPQIIEQLVNNYSDHDYSPETGVCLFTGEILQAFIRFMGEPIVEIILFSGGEKDEHSYMVWNFFKEYVDIPSFDVQTQAFNTLKEIFLTKHPKLGVVVRKSAVKLITNKEQEFFKHFNKMLQSPTFVTCRQSLMLLHQILFDPEKKTYKAMMHYINGKANLKIAMNLLRDSSDQIQFEAFHLFKVFVLNPKRSDEVTHVLSKPKNVKNLTAFLSTFKDKFKDSHFGSNESGVGYDLFQSELKSVIAGIKTLEKKEEEVLEASRQSSTETGAFGEPIESGAESGDQGVNR